MGAEQVPVEVLGLSEDRSRLVLRVGEQSVEVPLEDVRRAERRLAPARTREPLTPKVVQQRIRAGESAEQVARAGGWPVEAVQRYEGPVLAEREHHARAARLAEVDGRTVEELVAAHLGRPVEQLEWDSWLVENGRWEVRGGPVEGPALRLRWDPAGRQVQALDEPSRRALRASSPDDVLTAVLRPVASSNPGGSPSPTANPARRSRAEVPLWADITSQVSGREPRD